MGFLDLLLILKLNSVSYGMYVPISKRRNDLSETQNHFAYFTVTYSRLTMMRWMS